MSLLPDIPQNHLKELWMRVANISRMWLCKQALPALGTAGFHQNPEAVVRLFPRKSLAPQRDSAWNGEQRVAVAPSPVKLPCVTSGWGHLGSAPRCGRDSPGNWQR